MTLRFLSFFLSLFFAVNGSIAFAAKGGVCSEKLSKQKYDLESLKRSAGTYDNNKSEGMVAFEAYSVFSGAIKKALPKALVYNILNSYDLTIHRSNLIELITLIQKSKVKTAQTFPNLFAKMLEGKVLPLSIPDRVDNFLDDPNEQTFLKALGDNSLEEMQAYLYGQDPLNPSKDSLLGQYIAETGAATLVRTFPTTHRSGKQGQSKLVVAISAESAEIYHKYFDKPELLFHYHTPRQGTLLFGQAGVKGSYGRLSSQSPASFENVGTIAPHILLKTTEAGRARNFFRLASRNQNAALLPWSLSGYCATGGYTSCTHWVGNIPIGDEKVNSYTFPGKVDTYAYNDVSKGPQTQELKKYKKGSKDKNLKSVWTVPGHMQLWEVLNVKSAQTGGLLANPGYVAHVLSAMTSVDRVPVVFVVVENHKAKLIENFSMKTSPY